MNNNLKEKKTGARTTIIIIVTLILAHLSGVFLETLLTLVGVFVAVPMLTSIGIDFKGVWRKL